MHAEFFLVGGKCNEASVVEEYYWAIAGSGAFMLWPIRIHCVWIPAGLPCIFMTISVFNFDVLQILQNVTYVSWMSPLRNFRSIKG